MIIVVAGLPGSGKSTVGRALAEEFGAVFSDVDDTMPTVFKELLKRGEIIGEDLYDDYFYANLKRLKSLAQESDLVIADSLMLRTYQQRMLDAFSDAIYIYLEAGEDVLIHRLVDRKDHFFTHDMLKKLLTFQEEPIIEYVVIDASQPLDKVMSAVREVVTLRFSARSPIRGGPSPMAER